MGLSQFNHWTAVGGALRTPSAKRASLADAPCNHLKASLFSSVRLPVKSRRESGCKAFENPRFSCRIGWQERPVLSPLPVFLPHMGCFRSSAPCHAAVPRTTSARHTHCEVLSLAPAAGVSPAKRGEAQRSGERSDLDAPAAGYTVASERALARSWLASAVFATLIHFGIAHSPYAFGSEA